MDFYQQYFVSKAFFNLKLACHQACLLLKTSGKGLVEEFHKDDYRNGITQIFLLAIYFRSRQVTVFIND